MGSAAQEVRKVQAAILGIGKNLDSDAAEEALHEGAKIFESEMSQQAPVRTGKLSRNIVRETTVKTKKKVRVGTGPSGEAWYGVIVENHPDASKRRPFMRPTFDQKNREAVKKVVQELDNQLLAVLG